MPNHDSRMQLWPENETVSVSDSEILYDVVTSLPVDESEPLTADSIYKAYVEAKKDNDSWIKYYMISVALLVMTATNAISELSLFGTKLGVQFIGPTAIFYFSVCTLVYTNHELKMRMYRAFFKHMLDYMDGSDRGQVLLRYPLAFYGGEYVAWSARPAGFVVNWRFHLTSIPAALVTLMGWVLAVFGLMGLLGFSLEVIYNNANLSRLIKAAVFVGFFGSMFTSAAFLRNAKTKHEYTFDSVAQALEKKRRMQ